MGKFSFENSGWSGDLFDEAAFGDDWMTGGMMSKKDEEYLANVKMQKDGTVNFGERRNKKKETISLILTVIMIIVMGGLIVQLIINEQKNFEQKLWASEQERAGRLNSEERTLTPESLRGEGSLE